MLGFPHRDQALVYPQTVFVDNRALKEGVWYFEMRILQCKCETGTKGSVGVVEAGYLLFQDFVCDLLLCILPPILILLQSGTNRAIGL